MATDKTRNVSVRLPVETIEAIQDAADGEPIGTYIRRKLENGFPVLTTVGKSDKLARKTRRPELRDIDD